ncbi:MAG: hypothetical protein HZB55_16525 [Deltaproteobacteria bacterium]|nr:hypothetical protein [Deltaproteobacteria bacterium]
MNRVALLAAVWMLGAVPSGARVWQPDPGPATRSAPSVLDDEESRRIFRQSVALGIPEADLTDLVARCRGAGFTALELRRVLSLMVRAKLAGLPHDDLLNKLREGLAKRAPPDAIERAVESKAQSLRRAKSLVDALLTDGRATPDYGYALKVVADALEAGVAPVDVLRAVREGQSPQEGLPDLRRLFREVR